ncbi:MAG: HAMP domain-containing sensor histidine kinase [Saprospiraceae bacterium]|nr:HAMP domain-containing sensor histidine kinase [Saprospiraceae bacterium]
MSVGLIGTAVIQIFWFRSAIMIQEDRFDSDVFDALNAVEERLIEEEKKDLEAANFISTLGGKSSPFFTREVTEFLSESEAVRKQAITRLQQLNDTLSNTQEFVDLLSEQDDWTRGKRIFEVFDSRRALNPGDLESRLDVHALEAIIQQELSDRGIDMEYQYGVFSNKEQSFVILNGNYVVEVEDSEASSPGFSHDERNLYNSKYQVQLFASDYTPPGTLRVHFPNKSTWIWSELIPTLMGTIIFTGLILFCFSYTIWVIFRQKKVSEMKTDFINNMTHEFKTPIATISLAADSIISPMVISSKDKIERFAQIIKQENKRMLSQVERVLQMALIDKKEFQLKLSDVNLHDVIDQAIENANLQVQRRGGQIRKYLEATKPVIQGDQTHLSNVIHNLLDNANKYSPESPDISIRTRNVSDGVEVIVEDRGIGMTKEARKQIFDKFYRVHTGNLHDVKGFGLGLSYVKTITDAHNGHIDVKSEPGEGSSFILHFPHNGQKQHAAA